LHQYFDYIHLKNKKIISEIFRQEVGGINTDELGNQNDVSDPLDKISKNNNINLETSISKKKSWWRRLF
jgi:hypothetical protein